MGQDTRGCAEEGGVAGGAGSGNTENLGMAGSSDPGHLLPETGEWLEVRPAGPTQRWDSEAQLGSKRKKGL